MNSSQHHPQKKKNIDFVMSKPNWTKDKGVMDPSSVKEAASVQARPKREVIPPRKWSDFVIYK